MVKLSSICTVHAGSRIAQEVKKVMQPAVQTTSGSGACSSVAETSRNTPSACMRVPLPLGTRSRRSKRRGLTQSSKLMPLTSTYSVQPSFSKKLFVFRYMNGAPRSFTRKDKDIIARGFVSDIYLNATEQEVREEIHAVLLNSGLPPQLVGPNNFEFIDVNGKVAFVPSTKKEGFEFNGRIVKQLAGAGSLYIRLLEDLSPPVPAGPRVKEIAIISDSSDDECDLPPLPFKFRHDSSPDAMPTQHGDDQSQHLTETPYQSNSNFLSKEGSVDQLACVNPPVAETSTTHGSEQSHSVATFSVLNDEGSSILAQSCDNLVAEVESNSESFLSGRSSAMHMSSAAIDNDTLTPSVCTSSSLPSVDSLQSQGPSRFSSDIQQLQEPFPNFPAQFISTLYSISNCDFVATLDCLLKGDLPSILNLVRLNVMKNETDGSPNIHVPETDEGHDWAIAAFSFYKSSRFNPKSEVNVVLGGQPAIDVGGVRRTFFSIVYEKVVSGYLDMFEGPIMRLRPAFKISVLNSGILKIFGLMIGHNLLMDGIGFPYLSPPCYYYMAGKWNTAITFITDEDVSCRVRHVLKQVL